VKSTAQLAAACLLLFAFCGCSNNNDKPVANAAAMGCANSLSRIAHAKESWAARSGASSNAVPTWDDLDSYFRHGPPKCPEGGTYTIGALNELPKCSVAGHNEYFLSTLKPGP
jgi:hypothetical protein